jgi:hypothetical protein
VERTVTCERLAIRAARHEISIARSLKGLLGGNQIGRGVKIGAVNPILTQGNVDATDKATDLAISGDGYFVARGSDGESFTPRPIWFPPRRPMSDLAMISWNSARLALKPTVLALAMLSPITPSASPCAAKPDTPVYNEERIPI